MERPWQVKERTTNSSSSGADRSATQARVKACKSRVACGTAPCEGSTERRMSSISMARGYDRYFLL